MIGEELLKVLQDTSSDPVPPAFVCLPGFLFWQRPRRDAEPGNNSW